MRRIVLAGAVALAACQTDAPRMTAEQLRDVRATWAQCAALANVAATTLANRTADAAAARAVHHWPDTPQLGDADVVLRFATPPGFGGDRTTQTLARRVNGEWRVERREQSIVPAAAEPPHQPPLPDELRPQRPRYPIAVTAGAFDAEAAARINAALADPCLEREPAMAPAALPLRSGALDVCYDGAVFALQIEQANRVRTFVHGCTPRWRAGELMRILEAANPPNAVTTHALTPLIYVDESGADIPASTK